MEMEVQARSKYERLLVEESFPALRRGTVPTIFSALSYIKSTVGVGIFTLPFAIRSAGMWVGLLGFAFISVVAFYCVMLLVSIRVHRGCEDYAACGREALGTGGVFLANFAVISTQVGTHVVQAVFISGVLFHFVPAIPRYGWILLLSPVFVSLSWIRDVSHLRWPSMFGVLLLVAAVITVLIYGFLNLFPGDFIASQINHAPVDFFLFFGTSIYVFEGINMALPIHREMRHPESFGRMFFFVSLIMGVVFSGFAVCGYLSFLDVVRPIVVFNLPFNSGWLIAVSVLIIVELLLSFPLVFFPISWAVEHSIAPSLFPPTAPWRSRVSRTVLVMMIVCIASFVPRANLAVALTGAFSNALSGLILPAIFHLIIFWDTSRPISKVCNCLVLVFGVFAMAVSSTLVIASIANTIAGNQ